MSEEEIPPSIKNPLSLKADYADPSIYGWASVIVGILALLVGIAVLAISGEPTTLVIIILGGILFLAGFTVMKRGK
jgi:uncharacterized membrane protein HdeD (DUF308 family)